MALSKFQKEKLSAELKLLKQNAYLNDSPLGRIEEQSDKQMTRIFDADCKDLFNL